MNGAVHGCGDRSLRGAVERRVEGAVEVVALTRLPWSGSGSGVVSLARVPVGGILGFLRRNRWLCAHRRGTGDVRRDSSDLGGRDGR